MFTAPRRPVLGALAVGGCVVFAGLLVLAGLPARPSVALAGPAATGVLPPATILPSKGVATQLTPSIARKITADLVTDFKLEAQALRNRDKARAAAAAGGERLQGLWQQIGLASNRALIVPERRVESIQLNLEAAVRQAPPLAIATVTGTEAAHRGGNPADGGFPRQRDAVHADTRAPARPWPLRHRGHAGRHPRDCSRGSVGATASSGLGGIQLEDVAAQAGIDFRQNAFRTPRTTDTIAMMGGGVCWVDIDDDGWLDLFAVNSYSDLDYGYWLEHGGQPRSALFRNRNGRFTDVSRASGAGVGSAGTAVSPATSTATASATST